MPEAPPPPATAPESAAVSPVIYRSNGVPYGAQEPVKIEGYDFRNPLFLAESELRQLRLCHEMFVQLLADRFSLFLRLDFQLKLESVGTVTYRNLIEQLGTLTHISLFDAEELNGVGIMEAPLPLATAIVNRILGGPGKPDAQPRELTEIELVLIDDAMAIILEEWCHQWAKARKLNGRLIGKESSGRFLKTASDETIMLLSKVSVTWEEQSSVLHIAVPYRMVEGLIKELTEQERKYIQMGHISKRLHWSASYDDLNVPVFAQWRACQLPVQDLLELRVGDVLEFPQDLLQKTEITLMESPAFAGEIGIDAGKMVVTLREKIDLPDPFVP